eukprot:1523817-Pleurochrysis_carterae.AAC.1
MIRRQDPPQRSDQLHAQTVRATQQLGVPGPFDAQHVQDARVGDAQLPHRVLNVQVVCLKVDDVAAIALTQCPSTRHPTSTTT